MSEEEEFEFRLRFEREQGAAPKRDPKAERADFLRREFLTSPPMAMLRGVKDIVDTGAGFLSRLGGADEQARVRAQNAAGRAEFDRAAEGQILPQVARIGGNIAATAPAVTALGGAVAPMLPRLGAAIRSGGMTTGAAPTAGLARAGDIGIRMAGGGIGGGLAAGMVNPDDAAFGGALGALLPPAVSVAGAGGNALGQLFRSREAKAGAALAQALDVDDVAAVAAALRAAPELVPNSRPTVAQALQTPQAGILERVVSDSAGGVRLKEALQGQGVARLAALEDVAPTASGGFSMARQDLGESVARFANRERGRAKDATRAAFNAVPQDEAALYLPDLAQARDEFFGPGVFLGRGQADEAVRAAQQMGTESVPGVSLTRAPSGGGTTLAQAVRRAGGINMVRAEGRAGELRAMQGDVKNVLRRDSGQTLSQMAQRMYEEGFIPDNSADTLLDAMRAESRGASMISSFDVPERQWQSQLERSMGDAPEAAAVPKKVTLREFQGLRSSIGAAQRAAARDPERSREAAALSAMKQRLDDRINEVVRGDGAADEVLPIAWADALDEARKLKVKEVERFLTGPQAAIFRRGADGQPTVQGGEVAAKFWGQRPGLADDVASFRRLIDDNPELLGQFRSMVTTEGAETAGASGNLATKFVRWFESRRPGLERAFDETGFKTLERIARDVKRAESAAAAGSARGSNTYQNAANALSLGLLDNPAALAMANRIPYIGGGMDWMRETARTGKARQLADLLSDANLAADALVMGQPSRLTINGQPVAPALEALLLRSAPVVAADR